MSDNPTARESAAQVPLPELLRSIPRGEVLRITDNAIPFFPATTSIPVGIYAREAADVIERLRRMVAEDSEMRKEDAATITRLRAELAASAEALEIVDAAIKYWCDGSMNEIIQSDLLNRAARCAAAAKRAREAGAIAVNAGEKDKR